MIKYKYNDRCLEINGQKKFYEFPIQTCINIKNILILLFDPDSYSKKSGQFDNLLGIDEKGEILWKAEHPTTQSGDRYYQIKGSEDSLIAYSIYSFECKIDVLSGKIVESNFYK
jgi:hypothetical protein